MATVDIKIEGSLLIAAVVGSLTRHDVISVIKEYYPNGIVKDVIWDLTNGSMQSLRQHDLHEIAIAAKATSGTRQGCKTAYVGLAAVEFGLQRMYTAIAEIAGVPVKYHVFKTIEEARNWIAQPMI